MRDEVCVISIYSDEIRKHREFIFCSFASEHNANPCLKCRFDEVRE